MGSIENRLRRAEASVRGPVRCPGCGLRPRDQGHIVVSGKVEGKDPAPGLPEVCPECGRSTRVRIVVQFEEEGAGEGGGV